MGDAIDVHNFITKKIYSKYTIGYYLESIMFISEEKSYHKMSSLRRHIFTLLTLQITCYKLSNFIIGSTNQDLPSNNSTNAVNSIVKSRVTEMTTTRHLFDAVDEMTFHRR